MTRVGLQPFLWGILLSLALGAADLANAQELSTAESMLKQLAAEALDQGKPRADRVAAIRTLGQWATSQVTPDLVLLLQDKDPIVRTEAAVALGWEGNQEAVKGLMALLTSPSEHPGVRAAAGGALGRIGAVAAREALLSAVNAPEATVRLVSMEALAFGPLRSQVDPVPIMIALLKDEHQPLISRGRAAQGLGEAKDPRGFDVLLETLERGHKVELLPLTAKLKNEAETMAARTRLLSDIRAWSAQSLGQLGDQKALPALIAASEDPDDYFLRMKAVQALVVFKSPTTLPAFLKGLGDPFPLVRQASVHGVVTLKAREAVDPLIALLTDPDSQLRLLVVAALGEIADPKAKDPLTRLADSDPDPQIRAVAKEAIARLGAP